jgi:hypothetical protein
LPHTGHFERCEWWLGEVKNDDIARATATSASGARAPRAPRERGGVRRRVRGASDDAFKPVVEAEAVAVETKTKRAWVQIPPHRVVERKKKERAWVQIPESRIVETKEEDLLKAAFERALPK